MATVITVDMTANLSIDVIESEEFKLQQHSVVLNNALLHQ